MRLTYRRLAPFAKPYAGGFVIAACAALLSAALQLVGPWVQKELIDRVLPGHLGRELFNYTLLWGSAAVLAQVTRVLSAYVLSKTTQNMATEIRCRLASHATRCSYRDFQQNGVPQLMALMTNDSSRIAQDLVTIILAVLMGVFSLVGNAALLCAISLPLVLIAVVVVPVVLILGSSLMRPLESLARSVQNAMANLTVRVKDQLDGARDIRIASAQHWSAKAVENASSAYAMAFVRRDLFLGLAISVMDLSTLLPTVVVFLAGGLLVLKGRLSIGSLIAFSGYLVRILEAPRQLSGALGSLQPLKACLDRIYEFLEIPLESGGILELPPIVSPLALKQVSFRIGQKAILDSVDILLERGRDIAIVGESGSGKTSLALVMGALVRAESGAVLLGDRSLHQFQLDSIRKRIQAVFLDSHIFGASLRDNIRLGREYVSDSDVVNACRLAQLDGVIASFERGLDEIMQPGGTNLSSGQKQRVALARALACRPDFLILDEALSALDSATEHCFWEALLTSQDRPTIVYISHDLEMASKFERIYVMDSGRVVQNGTHAELVNQPGVYRTLWQARGYTSQQ